MLQKNSAKINGKLNVPISKINMQNIGEALTGYVSSINERQMMDSLTQHVKKGKIAYDNYIDVYSPRGNHKIRLRFPKYKNVRI